MGTKLLLISLVRSLRTRLSAVCGNYEHLCFLPSIQVCFGLIFTFIIISSDLVGAPPGAY